MPTDFTRIVLPDGNGRTVAGELPHRPGDVIARGEVAEWPELSGWCIRRREEFPGGRCEGGVWRAGSCTYLMVG